MRFLRVGAIGVFFTGVITAIQGCSENEKLLFLVWLFILSLFGGGSDEVVDVSEATVVTPCVFLFSDVSEDSDASDWQIVIPPGTAHTGTISSGVENMYFRVAMWSGSGLFDPQGQNISATFDNMKINTGTLSCP